MYGMMTALAPLTAGVNTTLLDDKSAVGIVQSVFWTASILSAPLWGRLNDKNYVKQVYLLTALVCGFSVVLQGLATNIWMLMIFRIVQGLTYSALIQSVMYVVVKACHRDLKGTFVGSTNSMLVVGQVIGSMFGAVVTSSYNPSITFIVMGVIFIGSSLILLFSRVNEMSEYQISMKLWELNDRRAK